MPTFEAATATAARLRALKLQHEVAVPLENAWLVKGGHVQELLLASYLGRISSSYSIINSGGSAGLAGRALETSLH